MRSLIVLIASSLSIWCQVVRAENLEDANCTMLFHGQEAVCSSPDLKKTGAIVRSNVLSVGNRMVLMKSDQNHKTVYQEVFSDKAPAVLTTAEVETLDKVFQVESDSSMSVDCKSHRKSCHIPEEKNDGAACTTECFETNQEVTEKVKPLGEIGKKLAEEKTCSKKEQEELSAKSCLSGKAGLHTAGSCAANLLFGMVKSLLSTVKFIYEAVQTVAVVLPAKGIDAVAGTHYAVKVREAGEKPTKYIENWWGATEKAENESSESMAAVAHTDKHEIEKTIAELEHKKIEKPEDLPPGMVQRFSDFLFESMVSSYSCLKWSGIPHGKNSKCLEEAKGWSCTDCQARMNIVCGSGGFLIGELGSAVLLGGFFKYVARGTKMTLDLSGAGADGIQTALSKMSKGTIRSAEEISYFAKSTEKIVAVTGSITGKIAKAKSTSLEFVMSQIKGVGKTLEDKLPPAILGFLASQSVQGPGKALSWYMNKMESVYSQAVGGAGKRLEVERTQAQVGVERAQTGLENLKKDPQNRDLAIKSSERELASAREKLNVANKSLEVHELGNLKNEFAEKMVKTKIEEAKKAGRPISASELKEISKTAEKAGELEQAKNLLIAYKGVEIMNSAGKASAQDVKERLTSVLHDSWRETRVASHKEIDNWIAEQSLREASMPAAEKELFKGIVAKARPVDGSPAIYPEYLPRIKPENASSSFAAADKAVDIANTSFQHLPQFWKEDNLKASENILTALKSYVGRDGKISSSFYNKMESAMKGPKGEQLEKVGKIFGETAQSGANAADPVVVAAAREFSKWKARTGTSYSSELELALVAETVSDVLEKNEKRNEIVKKVLK